MMEDQPFSLSRRDVLKISSVAAAGALVLGSEQTAQAASASAPVTDAAAQLILMQTAWSGTTARIVLEPALAALRDASEPHVFVLLPLGEGNGDESAISRQLAGLAKQFAVYLAGATPMRTVEGVATIGFIFGPDGRQLLRTPKYTPDFLRNFSDSTAAIGKPGAFPVADTPLGRFGMLIGEDILYGTHARALFFNGAEIILNPAAEVSNEAFAGRSAIPAALAVQNSVYVASATPARRNAGGFEERLPTRTALTDLHGIVVAAQGDESAVITTLDIESLRQIRLMTPEKIVLTQQSVLLVRDALYAPLFRVSAATMPVSAPPNSADGWRAEFRRRAAAQAKAMPHPVREDTYDVLMAQTAEIRSVRAAPDRKAEISRIIKDSLALIAKNASRPSARLVIFPEFAFSGAGWRTVEDIRSVGLSFPGKELDQICDFAQTNRIYVAFQQFEIDDKMPGSVFDTAFLVSDNGEILLRHRKMQCADVLGSVPDTTPGSVFDRYVQAYGLDSIVTVADTPIGKIGTMICAENMFPEITQLFVQKGAELLTHSTSEGFFANPRHGWTTSRQQMALTGTAYVASTDAGDVSGGTFQQYRPTGESQLIDYNGNIQMIMQPGAPGVMVAPVDLAALRRARQNPRRNVSVWDDPRIYADSYAQGKGVPNNLWPNPDVFPYGEQRAAMDVFNGYYDKGMYVRPANPTRPAKS